MKNSNMKRFLCLGLCVIVLISTLACGQKASTWQEQYDLGVRYLSEGKYEEAIIAFTAAIEIDPKKPEAYLDLAHAYIGLGNTDVARKVLEDGFAATGDADIQAMLDELTVSASKSLKSETLKLSNLTYQYMSGGATAEMNEGSVGELQINATIDGPDGVADVYIGAWYDEFPDEERLQSDIEYFSGIWEVYGHEGDTPFDFEEYRPVFPDELGKTQYVELIGLDGSGEAVAYAVVEVKIPG